MTRLLRIASILFCFALPNISNGESAVSVDEPAPGFELPGSDGKTYKLADFKGKQAVVIAWYPKAFTGG